MVRSVIICVEQRLEMSSVKIMLTLAVSPQSFTNALEYLKTAAASKTLVGEYLLMKLSASPRINKLNEKEPSYYTTAIGLTTATDRTLVSPPLFLNYPVA